MAESTTTPLDWESIRDKTIDMLVLERREMEAVNKDLLAVLKDVEWQFDVPSQKTICPRCLRAKYGHGHGHSKTCNLAVAIAKAEVTDNG